MFKFFLTVNLVLAVACFTFAAEVGKPCTRDPECPTGLSCISSTCSCPSRTSQIYVDKTCIGLPGAPCDSENKCIENAFCNSTSNVCQCSSAYSEDPSSGLCTVKSFGASCTEDFECSRLGLHCVKGKCSCKDLSEVFENDRAFPDKSRNCRIGVGHRCLFISPPHYEPVAECVKDAYCYLELPVDGNPPLEPPKAGKCGCIYDFQPDFNTKTCVRKVNF